MRYLYRFHYQAEIPGKDRFRKRIYRTRSPLGFGRRRIAVAGLRLKQPQRAVVPFWADLAARFRDNPNVFFAPLSARAVPSIRQTGALQPVIIDGPETALLGERNIIYEMTPHYAALKTDAGRRQQFGDARGAPLLVNGLDPELTSVQKVVRRFPVIPLTPLFWF